MPKFKFKRIIFLVALSSLISAVIVLANPHLTIKLYKSVNVKYVRIAKSDFAKRFNSAQLNTAIAHAASQSWVQQQIAADLAPYKNGVSHAQIMQWFTELQHETQNKLALFSIKDGKLSTSVAADISESRAYKTVYSIIELLNAQGHLPDCEFIVALNDYLSYVPAEQTTPAAIFSFAKHTEIPVERDTILIPDWMNVRYWDVLRSRIDLASSIYPWQRKKELIHWRGGRADSMQHRTRLLSLTNTFDFLDVGMTEGDNKVAYMDPEFSVQYKFQIALDGARCTWERMVWQMHSNTVLLKPKSPQIQWYHRGLVPYKNYVPMADVTATDVAETYNWLKTHDLQAQKIVQNANTFARENFKTEDFFAYYAVLLQEYAKLQR